MTMLDWSYLIPRYKTINRQRVKEAGEFVVDGYDLYLSTEGAIALVRAKGHSLTGDSNRDRAIVVGTRSDNGDTMRVEFTWDDAKDAKLTNNPTYAKYPADMLFYRAARRVCKRTFGDVLGGLEIRDAHEIRGERYHEEGAPGGRVTTLASGGPVPTTGADSGLWETTPSERPVGSQRSGYRPGAPPDDQPPPDAYDHPPGEAPQTSAKTTDDASRQDAYDHMRNLELAAIRRELGRRESDPAVLGRFLAERYEVDHTTKLSPEQRASLLADLGLDPKTGEPADPTASPGDFLPGFEPFEASANG